MFVSASRFQPIGRQGLALTLRSPHPVTVIADGKTQQITTTAATVRDVLTQAGITLRTLDETNPALAAYPAPGATIRVVRVDAKRVVAQVDIPFSVQRVADASMSKGDEKVQTNGVTGVKQVTYDQLTRDGKLAKQTVVSEKVIKQPVTQVVRYGTKPAAASSHGSTGADGLNWAALAECESGGNPKAVNPAGPYYGLYQFSLSTWHAVGGTGKPIDWGPAEQTYRAQVLYKRAGAGQWPVCGKHLFD
jgi:uncharacterized protein YabE (DUF348 family)